MRNSSNKALQGFSAIAVASLLGAGVFYACSSNETSSPVNSGTGGAGTGGAGTGGSGTDGSGTGGSGAGGAGTGGSGTGGAGTGGSGTGGSGTDSSATGGAGGGTDSGTADSGPVNPSCPGTDTSALFSAPSNPTGSWPPPALKLTKVGPTFSQPTLVLGAPGDTTRLYVVQQGGLIRLVKNGGNTATTFLDATDVVSGDGGERGLLGLAFHPAYAQNGRFFVYYNEKTHGDIRIAEYARSSGNADQANNTATKVLVSIVHQNGGHQAQGNHNGGMIAFGKDGFLYAGTGDGGPGLGGDPDGNAQNMDVELGKILRFDVDHPDCSVGGNLKGRIWDYGVRNPWRWSFDRLNGDLYIGEVGQGAWEEVDVEPQGQGNKNYGWNAVEGTHCFKSGCDMSGTVLPILDYGHTANRVCIIGGFVYRGAAIPALSGTYFYADHGSNQIWALQWNNGALAHGPTEVTSDLATGASLSGIGAFGQDSAGELYVVNNGNGNVYRIDAE